MTGALFIAVVIYVSQSYIEMQHFVRQNMNAAFVDPKYLDFILNGFFNNLRTSIIVFIIFAVIFVFVSKIITNWIVKPAEESFDKQKNFIADASHELKTPLAVIMASNDAIEKTETNSRWINNIKTEADRMNHLISKLLDLASTENISNSKLINGNLSKTIELAALTFEGRALEKQCSIKLDIEEDIQYKYDDNDIKQLIEILLDNAIKHSFESSDIFLSLKKMSNKITLSVKNQGDLIPKGAEEHIFERFYRIDKARSQKDNSYGLGLSIAKNIAKNNNAHIYAYSQTPYTYFVVDFL